MTQLPPTPRDVRTAEEYVGKARCLKAWSGYSYRELSRRAAANGDHLPSSTLATALRRASLPGERLVAAFVRACGCDAATVEEWTAVRRRIAMEAENRPVPPDDGAAPAPAGRPVEEPFGPQRPRMHLPEEDGRETAAGPPGGRARAPGRRRGLIRFLAVGAVTLVCAVGSAPQLSRPPAGRHMPEARRPAGPLADGWYRIHTVPDDHCLEVTGPPGGRTVHGRECGRRAGQRFYFEYAGDGAYRIRSGLSGGDLGCLAVAAAPPAGTAWGDLRVRACTRTDPGQLLHLEVVPEHRRHHWLPSRLRMRSAAGRLAVRATRPDGGALDFYLTDVESPTAPPGRADVR